MLNVIVLLAVVWQQAVFEVRVHLRFADGAPAPGVTVRAQQGAEYIAGECVTDAEGWCKLTMTFDDYGDEPVIKIDGYTFGPYYGVEGDGDQFILWPEILTSDQPVGLVLDAPGAAGVVIDLNPDGALVIPFWNGMSPTEQAAAYSTQAAIINPPTSAPTTTPTPRPLTNTPRPTLVPASRTPVPTATTLVTASATPTSAVAKTSLPSGWVIAGVVLVIMLFLGAAVLAIRRMEQRP